MKTIEEMAEEAGAIVWDSEGAGFACDFSPGGVERFAALVRAQAMEEAARIVERIEGWTGTREVAAAIRAAANG